LYRGAVRESSVDERLDVRRRLEHRLAPDCLDRGARRQRVAADHLHEWQAMPTSGSLDWFWSSEVVLCVDCAALNQESMFYPGRDTRGGAFDGQPLFLQSAERDGAYVSPAGSSIDTGLRRARSP
jgi:hypothetical protein